MSDKNQNLFKQRLLIALILLLFLIVSVQAGYIHKMQKQLNLVHQQQSSLLQQLETQSVTQETSVTNKIVPEVNDTVAAQNLTDDKPLSLQENQQTQPAQQQDQNAAPEDATAFINDNSYTAFDNPRWDPYAEIERMQREMDRMFDHRFSQYYNPGNYNHPDYNYPDFQRHFRLSTSTPEIDIKENDFQYMVMVNLPGADENDISVTLDGQRLTIKGKRHYEKQDRSPNGNIVFQERQSGKFKRSLTLAHPVQQNKMKTRLDNGILKILIPKVTYEQRR
jgi:HSP20 family protein